MARNKKYFLYFIVVQTHIQDLKTCLVDSNAPYIAKPYAIAAEDHQQEPGTRSWKGIQALVHG